jgi:hypothetical protein
LTQAVVIAIAVVLSWYLLRGSRIAWCVILIDAVGHLGEAIIVNDEYVNLLLYGAIVAALSLPASFRFIWQRDGANSSLVPPSGLFGKTQEAMYRIFMFFVSWESGMKHEGPWDAEGYRSMLTRIGLFTLFSLPVVVATYQWEQNSTSSVASVLADLAWIAYAIFQVTFIVLCGVGLYRYLTRDRSHSNSKTV